MYLLYCYSTKDTLRVLKRKPSECVFNVEPIKKLYTTVVALLLFSYVYFLKIKKIIISDFVQKLKSKMSATVCFLVTIKHLFKKFYFNAS